MLNLFVKHIGGFVRTTENDKFIIWVVNNKKQINHINKIFINYPPLTTRLRGQLAFMLECFKHNNVELYLNTRNFKYSNTNKNNFNIDCNYFNEWLSGFIEAEGSFSIRHFSNNHSFSIGKNNDKYLINKIKSHFDIKNEIRKIGDNFWFIEVYRKSTLIKIINHGINYPFLGNKTLSFNKFKDLFI
jgi:hypothetical protein